MKLHGISILAAAALLAPAAEGQLPINVEIDYMEDATHSHRPTQLEVDALVQMFACQGYTLNLVIDDALPHVDVMRCPDPANQDFWSCIGPEAFLLLRATYQDMGGAGWHYCIFGHDYDSGDGTGSSGLGQVLGEYFIVTLGSFRLGTPNAMVGTPFDRASTLAHELGHNLGLRHWSPNSSFVSGDYAPNYASVMSYQYQLGGVRSQLACLGLVDAPHLFKELDYSSGRLPELQEFALVESVGVGIHNVDWNCDGAVTPGNVVADLDDDSPWCGPGPSPIGFLRDHDDWANLLDVAWLPDSARAAIEVDTVSCITAKEFDALASEDGLADPSGCGGSQPNLGVEPCPAGVMAFVDPSFVGIPVGTGDNPFPGIAGAVGATPAGSVLYLQSGVHTNAGSTLLIGTPVTLASPGGALVDP